MNDTAIPESEVRRAILLSPLRPEPGETPEAFRTLIVNALIDQHLQYEDALRFGPAPPDAAEVSAALERLRERLRADGKDPASEFAAAGLTPEQVRASVERQLIVSRYVRERFRPTTFVGEEDARDEYDSRYVPERQAAGGPARPFEQISEEMTARVQRRNFDEEIERWISELRDRARIRIYPSPVPAIAPGTPTMLATAPPGPEPTPTTLPTPRPTPAG